MSAKDDGGTRDAASTGRLIVTLLAGLALLLALATVWQSSTNRQVQRRIADNQTRLVKAQTIANVDNSLIQLLAKSAVEDNDMSLRELLSRNGVTLKQGAVPGAAADGK